MFRKKNTTRLLSDIKFLRRFNYNRISFILAILIFAWALVTSGYALSSPRIAYQEFRAGSGFIWAFMVSISTYFAASISLLDSLQSVRNLKYYIILFELALYSSGSKGVVLWNNVMAILIAKPSRVIGIFKIKQLSRLKKYISSFVFVPFLLWIFVLFGGSGSDGILQKVFNYMSSTKLAVQYVEYLDETDDYTNGQIFTSGLWSFVPRRFFPSKPYAYGSILMNEKLFPGMAASGHTPSLGLFTKHFSDFKWFGIFFNILSPSYILALYGISILVSRTQVSTSLSIFSIFYTAFPMISFHIPIIFSLLFYLLLFRLTSTKTLYNT